MKRILCLISFFGCLSLSSLGQPQDLDSLKRGLGQQEGKKLLAAIEQLGVSYYYIQMDSALAYMQHLEQEALRQGNKAYLASALGTQGLCLDMLGYPDSGLVQRRKSLWLYTSLGDSDRISAQTMGVGLAHMNLAQYDSSMHYLLQGLRLQKQLEPSDRLGRYYGNLGTLHAYLKDNEAALGYYRLEAKEGSELKDTLSTINGYGGMASAFQKLAKLDSAAYFYRLAQRLAEKKQAQHELIAILAGRGRLYFDLALYDSSAQFSLSAAKAYQAQGQVFHQHEMAYQAASAMFLAGRRMEARSQLRSSLAASRKMATPHLEQKILQSLAEMLEAEDSLAQALALFRQAETLEDSLLSLARQERIVELETQYRSEKTRHELVEARRKAQLEQLSKELTMLYAALGTLLLGILLFFLWRRLRLQRQRLRHTEQALQESKEHGDSLAQAVERRNQELTTQTLSIIKKNSSLRQAREELNALETALPEQRLPLRKLQRLVADGLSSERDWAYLELAFAKVGDGFFERLRERYPNLSVAETRLCALAHLQLSIKDSAQLLNISPNSLKVSRSRLKKKMGLSTEESLDYFLSRF